LNLHKAHPTCFGICNLNLQRGLKPIRATVRTSSGDDTMVVRLSEEKKYEILSAHRKLQNAAKVARQCAVHEKTVRKWVKRHAQCENMAVRKSTGRKKALTSEAAALAVDLLLDKNFGTTSSVAAKLHQQGHTTGTKPVHRTTVARAAKAAAAAAGQPIYVSRGRPVKQLTPPTMKKRLQFCQANLARNWNHVMFSDRKKFSFKYPGTQVKHVQWSRKGNKPQAYTPSHPMVVNVYAGITKFGVSKTHFVTGTSKMKSVFLTKQGKSARNITSSEYQQVLSKTLLPEAKRLFSEQGLSSGVFQQDNDPTHKKASLKALEEWNSQHPGQQLTLLPAWPPHSPDLNLIENVWAWAERKVDAEGCKTFEEFKQCVVKTLQNVPKTMLTNLYASMSGRLKMCIESKGDRIKY
jgi:transposase